jgi:hypothetical protein
MENNTRVTPVESEREPERSTPIPGAVTVAIETRDVTTSSNDASHRADTADAASVQPDAAISHPVPSSELAKSQDAIEDEDDPFKLMGNDSKVAPGAVDDQHDFGERQDMPIDDVR